MTMKFAVAGTGWVSGEYFKVLQTRADTEVCGVFSASPQGAKERLAQYGVSAPVFDNFEQLLEKTNADVVVLCSTPDVRHEQAIMAANYGKHLVLDKPLAMNKKDLWEMAEAIGKSGVKTVASFILRWVPSIRNTKALLEDDAIGRVFMAQVDYWHHVGPQYGQYRWSRTKELGGSSLLSAGCHAVDALRHLAGEVEEVAAYDSRTWSHSDYEFDPNMTAVLRLTNGGTGIVTSSLECKTPYKFNVRLLGEKGTILDNALYSHKLPWQQGYATIPAILPDSGDVTHHPFADELDDIIRSVRNGAPSLCDFADACKTMELCFAIDEAAVSGGRVKVTSFF